MSKSRHHIFSTDYKKSTLKTLAMLDVEKICSDLIERLIEWIVQADHEVWKIKSTDQTCFSSTSSSMVHLLCRRQTRVQTQIRIPNLMATLYSAEYVHIAQTLTRIPTPVSVQDRNSSPSHTLVRLRQCK